VEVRDTCYMETRLEEEVRDTCHMETRLEEEVRYICHMETRLEEEVRDTCHTETTLEGEVRYICHTRDQAGGGGQGYLPHGDQAGGRGQGHLTHRGQAGGGGQVYLPHGRPGPRRRSGIPARRDTSWRRSSCIPATLETKLEEKVRYTCHTGDQAGGGARQVDGQHIRQRGREPTVLPRTEQEHSTSRTTSQN
jgi:hypothetical protein